MVVRELISKTKGVNVIHINKEGDTPTPHTSITDFSKLMEYLDNEVVDYLVWVNNDCEDQEVVLSITVKNDENKNSTTTKKNVPSLAVKSAYTKLEEGIARNKNTAININSKVSVVLSTYGAEILNEYNKKLMKDFNGLGFPALTTDFIGGELYEDQLWNIMQIFGPSISATTIAPFVNCNIYMSNKDLRKEREYDL